MSVKVKEKIYYFLFIILILFAIFIRLIGFNFVSEDMRLFLLPWFYEIKHAGGFLALQNQVGNYGLLYQTIIAWFTYFDMYPVYLYKLLSVAFDFLLAFSFSYFICKDREIPFLKGNLWFVISSSFLILPIIIMNSSYWGQCDSIYAFFLLWSVWFLYKENYLFSFLMFGIALSFKLQTLFLFLLFLFIYFYKQKFSMFYFFISLFTFWISGIVAYFYGRNIFDGFLIYFQQIDRYPVMYKNFPSFWVLVSNDYGYFCVPAIILTCVILFVGLYLIKNKIKIESFETIISLAIFIEWTCVLFLPSMHERYSYVLDLLLLSLCFYNNRFIKYFILSVIMSLFLYIGYFCNLEINDNFFLPLIYLLFYLHYSYVLIKNF